MPDRNNTTPGCSLPCEPYPPNWGFWGIILILVLSLCLNIIYCVSKCSGKRMCRPSTKRRRGLRQMEENPIYGNLGYIETSMTLTTDDSPRQRVNSDSQSKSQDCYANLTIKPTKIKTARSSHQVQYSDVLERPEEPEKKGEGSIPETVSSMSDLYASVQTQRTKTVQPAVDGEEYANHL